MDASLPETASLPQTASPETASLPQTPAQTIGPFFKFALPVDGGPHLVPEGHPGAVRVSGRVLDGAGEPVSDALIEIVQEEAAPGGGGFGRCATDGAGRFAFVTAKPPAT